MKKMDILYFIVFILVGIGLIYFNDNKIDKQEKNVENSIKKELVIQKTNFKQSSGKLDINSASFEELQIRKISKNAATNILKYREIIGCIENLDDLKNIKGIGEATLNKVKDSFYVKYPLEEKVVKKININDVDSEVLKWLKFTPKEIKKIEKCKEENGSIFSNLELLDILGSERYDIYTNKIKYSN
ncbi:MAG: helix-hairpin-helix domain-containing protein [Fusobacteria bacterium]|nr:helix-hairpin-helix domain-containing protein [Fusobacteriota bacterium]